MSYFQTPRRRHSSLFQRMENEIKKITKKLSAAKDSYRYSSAKPKKNHFTSYNSIEDKNPLTVRKNSNQAIETTLPIKSNTTNIRQKYAQDSALSRSREILNINEPLILIDKTLNNANKIIIRLQDENSKLSHRLGKIQAICQNQSYKIGYMKAELRQTSRELALQKQKQMKQACYLTTLMEHYKSKAKKYKKILKQNSAVSIDLGTDSNV